MKTLVACRIFPFVPNLRLGNGLPGKLQLRLAVKKLNYSVENNKLTFRLLCRQTFAFFNNG